MRWRSHVILASAAGVATLTGFLLVPAAASAQPAGTAAASTITLALSPATVDYGHQNVTASGTVTTSAGPVADATVTVSYVDIDQQSAQVSLTTGTNGSYSGTIPDPETAAQTVTASVVGTSSTVSEPLGFTTDAVTITASFAQPSVNANSTDTLSGVATYTAPGGTSQPLANSPLSVSFTESGDFHYSFSATVETAADGSFSYVTPAIYLAEQSATASVSSAATAYLDAGQLSVTIPINQAAQFDYFSATVSPERVLQFVACAGLPEPLANSPLIGPVDFQYSTGPNGPWKTLGTAKSEAYNPGDCSSGQDLDGTYTGKFTAPLANAYYRAYAPAVPGQTSAVSQVIHLHRDPTKITGFTITPRKVRRGGKVTVSGRLWRLKGTWLPDARAQIVIEFRYKGKTYTLTHRLTTGSSGRFHGTFPVPHTAAWLALYRGGGSDFGVTSKAITVKVR